MTIYQFNSYMNNITEVEKMLSGGKQKDTTTTEDLMKAAQKKGIKTPTKY